MFFQTYLRKLKRIKLRAPIQIDATLLTLTYYIAIATQLIRSSVCCPLTTGCSQTVETSQLVLLLNIRSVTTAYY